MKTVSAFEIMIIKTYILLDKVFTNIHKMKLRQLRKYTSTKLKQACGKIVS